MKSFVVQSAGSKSTFSVLGMSAANATRALGGLVSAVSGPGGFFEMRTFCESCFDEQARPAMVGGLKNRDCPFCDEVAWVHCDEAICLTCSESDQRDRESAFSREIALDPDLDPVLIFSGDDWN